MKHSKFLLLILIFFCQLAMSQTNGLVEVKGMGGQTCAQYIEHKKSAPPLLVQLYAQWAQGSYSGSQAVFQDFRMYNGTNKGYVDGFVPPPSIVTWG